MARSNHIVVMASMLFACLELTSSQTTRTRTWWEGREYTLECQLNGATDANQVTWTYPAQEDRVRIVPSGSVSLLTVSDVRIEDEGSYECRHPSGSAPLVQYAVSVFGVPEYVANQRTEYSVYEGEDLILLPCQVRHCTGSNCFVHWKRNFNTIDSVSSVEGIITTKSITLMNVQQIDSGSYVCLISNPYKELVFTVAVIPANERVPMLDKSTENQYKEFHYDQALKLSCPIRSGENSTENPMTVSWVFTNIHGQPQYVNVSGTVLSLEPEHYNRGEYKCTASNDFGLDSLDIFVEINAPPLPALVPLPNLTLTESSPTETLDFTAPTTPVALSSLDYQWARFIINEEWTPIQFNGKYNLTNNGHLLIHDITLSDAGLYRVTISNKFGASIQTRHVNVSPRPTPGPVEIGFTFTLPESLSCSQIQESSEQLTAHLSHYLSNLCANTTSLRKACSGLAIHDVSIECNSREAAFTARLRSSSSTRQMARAFEENGPTRLSHNININPCGDGQCVLPTEAIESLRDLVAVLVAVVMVLVVVVIVTIIIVICVLKHKGCTKNCQVSNLENGRVGSHETGNLHQAFESNITNDYTLHPPHTPHPLHTPQYTHNTLGQANSLNIYN